MAKQEAAGRPLKIVVVGDGTVGKTCLLIAYTTNSFPTEHIPTVFDNYAANKTVDGVEFRLTLWDTAGQEDYARLRPLAYPNTDCFIVCYAINQRSSMENVVTKWMPELRHHCPKSAIVLVGTKADLAPESQDPVTEKEGAKLKSKIRANAFRHCSARTGQGIDEVIVDCVRAVMKQSNRRKLCQYL